jgi:subtilisin family serine protease
MAHRSKIIKQIAFLPVYLVLVGAISLYHPAKISDAGFINFSLEQIKEEKITKLIVDRSLKDRALSYDVTSSEEISEINKVAVTFKSEDEAEKFARESSKEDQSLVEKNVQVKAFFDDPYYEEQTNLGQMHMQAGWPYLSSASSVKIAIIDTGVRGTHEDLTGRVIAGYNFLNNSAILANTDSDNNGHGTAMASLAAASANNGLGMVGVSYTSQIMPLKALNSAGSGDASDVAEAIVWAANNGAGVINLSLGSDDYSQSLHDAIQFAVNRNVIVVAASGNGGGAIAYPARDSLVFSVGSVNSSDSRSSFSGHGNELDVVAPGEAVTIAGDAADDSYGTATGTSASAAEVSGLAALGKIWHSGASPAEVTRFIELSTVKPNGMGGASFNEYYGHGLVSYDRLQTVVGGYRAQFAGQSAYPTLWSGQSTQLTIRYKNTGTSTWRKGVVNLGTVNEDYSWKTDSHPAAYNWVNQNRPARLNESIVQPGQTGTFTFTVRNNALAPGTHRLDVGLVADGISWFDRNTHAYWDITVNPAYRAQFAGQSRYPTLWSGQTTDLTIRYKNTGSVTWRRGVVNLGTVNQDYSWRNDPHPTARNWVNPNRPARLNEATVAPGETGSFTFTVRNNALAGGNYRLDVGLVADGIGWFEKNTHAYWDIYVKPAYQAEFAGQSRYPTLWSGQTAELTIRYKNTGSVSWRKGIVSIGTVNPDFSWRTDSHPVARNWISGNRPARLNEDVVAPGETGSFTFTVRNNALTPGNYRLDVGLVADGIGWFDRSTHAYWDITATK